MTQRVSHGACPRCGKPILYQGAAYCSPQCNQLGPAPIGRELGAMRTALGLDTETDLMRRGLLAPPLACVTWKNGHERAIVHVREAKEHVVRHLKNDPLIVGFNIAYDMCVICAEWPDLIPLVFQAYSEDRITDCNWREKLRDIAEGTYHYADSETEDGAQVYLTYSLEEVAYRRCRIKLDKGGWQLRFGELIETPMSFWPLEAQQYAVMDAVATEAVFLDQEREDRARDISYFADEFRQTRAYFWLQLMGCWGFHTDPASVREFARKAKLKYETLRDELVPTGLVTKQVKKNGDVKYTKKKKPVQALVRQEKESKGQKVPLTKTAEKKLDLLEDLLENEHVPAKRASIERRIQECLDSVTTDKDVCSRADHPWLKKYADLSHYEHMLTSDVPLLELGTSFPIQGKFDLADTGRTTSTLHFGLKGNTQNWSTSNGMRECVTPRPRCIFAVGDYAGFELRTWSQLCLWKFGHTLMGDMLNKGLDPHLQMAAWILNIPYEEAHADFQQNPKGRVYFPRQSGKVADFGYPGGLGADRFVDYARRNYNVVVTREQAVELREHWLSWPEAQLWLDWASEQVKAHNFQFKHPVSERVRYVDRFTEYANGPFQALAADAAKNAGFLIAHACYADTNSVLYGSRPCKFIHDEFVLEVKDDEYAHDKAVELARLMEVGAKPFLPDIPPVVEPMLGRKWSKSMKAVKDKQTGRLVPWEPKEMAA